MVVVTLNVWKDRPRRYFEATLREDKILDGDVRVGRYITTLSASDLISLTVSISQEIARRRLAKNAEDIHFVFAPGYVFTRDFTAEEQEKVKKQILSKYSAGGGI